jgi:ADP-ribose pyrophosphatase YjhB (NUDIX family)
MPELPPKTRRLRPTKEVSVMAWIEDLANGVLLVRQVAGLKLWTLSGGKVKRSESLVRALKREVAKKLGCVSSDGYLSCVRTLSESTLGWRLSN